MGIFSSILPSKEEKKLRELKGRLDSLGDRIPEEGKESLSGVLALIQHVEGRMRRGKKENTMDALENIETEISRLEILVGEYLALKNTIVSSIVDILGTPRLDESAIFATSSPAGSSPTNNRTEERIHVMRYIDHARKNHVAVLLDDEFQPVAIDSVVSMVVRLNTQPVTGRVLIVPTVVTNVLVELARRRNIGTVIGREVDDRTLGTDGVRVLTFDTYSGGR
ncbi:hypothetical protein [Thermococcus sp. 18S1]|uniref:hypothetical protein n=1 Tax=Thermococcus sp. 18S1 TaxID=1638210 RepID=UPI00143C86A0|nr:hypothetical protein [Thermococcus sp. 18S1]